MRKICYSLTPARATRRRASAPASLTAARKTVPEGISLGLRSDKRYVKAKSPGKGVENLVSREAPVAEPLAARRMLVSRNSLTFRRQSDAGPPRLLRPMRPIALEKTAEVLATRPPARAIARRETASAPASAPGAMRRRRLRFPQVCPLLELTSTAVARQGSDRGHAFASPPLSVPSSAAPRPPANANVPQPLPLHDGLFERRRGRCWRRWGRGWRWRWSVRDPRGRRVRARDGIMFRR